MKKWSQVTDNMDMIHSWNKRVRNNIFKAAEGSGRIVNFMK
jgi:hypothetical protein